MPPRRPEDRLVRTADGVWRGFARLGAVVVAALGFVLRTRSGRQAAQRGNRALDAFAARATRWLDRLAGKFLA
ncbi:MAG TPA: hypothetical protein VKY74_26180 [Chloroflexia bacterium]|nr:hypothetical protein [Chloroflexia bacterium]